MLVDAVVPFYRLIFPIVKG